MSPNFEEKSKLVVLTAPGLRPYLEIDLQDLGFTGEAVGQTGVSFEGDLSDAMFINLHARCAYRVLYELHTFQCKNPDQLYQECNTINWSKWFAPDEHLTVDSFVKNDSIRDTRFPNLKLKDAIVDHFMRFHDKRPDSGPEKKGIVVYLYWVEDIATVYLDTSGDPLSRRGYRSGVHPAPLSEILAYALLRACEWTPEIPLVNPMCGSGTIAIEAAIWALNRAPSLNREHFAFMNFRGFEQEAWEELKTKAVAAERSTIDIPILASDIDQPAIAIATRNAANAGVEEFITFQCCDFEEGNLTEEPGLILMNPEYGRRMGSTDDLFSTYGRIGSYFKHKAEGWKGAILSGEFDLLKNVGLRPKKKIPVLNGNLECKLVIYELYKGSKKGKYTGDADHTD